MRVTYEVAGSIATIAMDDGKANALGFDMLDELNEALDRTESDQVAAVITGRAGLFSAGFDLGVFAPGGPDMVRLMKMGFEFCCRLLSFPRPVVMACTGHAFAMAVFVLLSGDYRIGVVNADHKITANEVAIGISMPRAAIELSRHRLSPEHLDRVVAHAEVFNPNSAMDVGVLDEVVPADDLLDTARSKATELMALNQSAFSTTKLRAHENGLSALRLAIEADCAELSSYQDSHGS